MVGVPDPVLGEIGVAFVVPADGTDPDPAELLADAAGRGTVPALADYKAPDRLVVVDRLPLTSMMKVDKRALADRAALETNGAAPVMTGSSTPAQGGVTDDPIRIGTMLYTLVEPHRGHEVAYNRWYERDHFYAGCQIGAYNFAGARFVATAPLKELRYPRRATGRLAGGRPGRSAATSASTTSSTATTTSGTGGRSTRSTCSTPPAGCSSTGTTSTPASTASSGSTAATPTGCRPSSPSTTGSPAWPRSSSSRPRA